MNPEGIPNDNSRVGAGEDADANLGWLNRMYVGR